VILRVSEYHTIDFERLILDLYDRKSDIKMNYTMTTILGMFLVHNISEKNLDITRCHEMLESEYEYKGGIVYEVVRKHIQKLVKLGALESIGPYSIDEINPHSDYFGITDFGIFCLIVNRSEVMRTNFLNTIRSTLKFKFFEIFLFRYISKAAMIKLNDRDVINYIYKFVASICNDITNTLERVHFTVENGIPESYYMTYYFEEQRVYREMEMEMAGPKEFVHDLYKKYGINWENLDKVKIKSLKPFVKYQITDGKIDLILEVQTRRGKAILFENGRNVLEFEATKYSDTYYEICPIRRISKEQYLDDNLSIDNIISHTTFDTLCNDIIICGMSSPKEDIAILYRDENFTKILEQYIQSAVRKYNDIVFFNAVYSQKNSFFTLE
jgi:hypothetical protein